MKHVLYSILLLALFAGCSGPEKRSAPPPPPQVGMQGLPQQPQEPSVIVQGDVRNHVIPWAEEMTLADALAAAEYKSYFDPRQIIVIRQGQATRIEPRQLLRGRQNPVLEPGDIIQIQ